MKEGGIVLLWFVGVYSVCALAVIIGLFWLTREARSCDRKTCMYYVRYLRQGSPVLSHAEFHRAQADWMGVKNYVDALHAAKQPIPPEKLAELKELGEKVRR